MVVMSSNIHGNHQDSGGGRGDAGGSASNGAMAGIAGVAGLPDERIPPVYIERPKMPKTTWEALKNHIITQRKKKKQEQEQTEEVERQKKEREHKKKQEALTLEDTKEEIANLERKLQELKDEKEKLITTLKKVLNEDDKRQKKVEVPQPQIYMQPNPSRSAAMNGHYSMKPHPHLLPPGSLAHQQNQAAAAAAAAQAAQQAMQLSHGSKRPRSPSPPRSGIPSAYYRTQPSHVAPTGGSKYNYSTSAVSSVSASIIYGSGSKGSAVASSYGAGGVPSRDVTSIRSYTAGGPPPPPSQVTTANLAAAAQARGLQLASVSGNPGGASISLIGGGGPSGGYRGAPLATATQQLRYAPTTTTTSVLSRVGLPPGQSQNGQPPPRQFH